MKLQKTERIVKRIMEISLALMVVGIFVVVGDMAYRQSTTGTDPELNWWFVGPMVLFAGLSLLCIALMFLFEVIHLCLQAGMKQERVWLAIVITVLALLLLGVLFWQFDVMRSQGVIMAFSLAVTAVVMKAYFRIGNAAKKK